VFVLLMQVAASSPRAPPRSSSLTAAAQASARPKECAVTVSSSTVRWGAKVWDAARDPTLDRYCDLLAKGYAELPFSPDAALRTADQADQASSGRAGPSVLRARAYANLKSWDKAAAEFERARGIDSRSIEDPLSMREWARALGRVGRASEALAVYRTLGPRLSALSSADERARTFLEGAEVAFSIGATALEDAIAFLGEAKQLAARDLEWRVGAELALALDRKGAKDEAAGLVAELARRRRSGPRTTADPPSPDEQAATALVLEAIDVRQALEGWDRYLEAVGAGAPFAEHARQRAALLRRRGGANR